MPVRVTCVNEMRYESVQRLSAEDFKRSTGVERLTFAKMLEVVGQGLRNFGRPPKLRRAGQLLLTLMCWREYRAEFHIGLAYGISGAGRLKKLKARSLSRSNFTCPAKERFSPAA